jgi:hypothetical protein
LGQPSQSSIDILIKNEQLASLADVSPFTVSRQLKQWDGRASSARVAASCAFSRPSNLLMD